MQTFWVFTALLFFNDGHLEIMGSGDFEYREDCDMFRDEALVRYWANDGIKRFSVTLCNPVERLVLATADVEELT